MANSDHYNFARAGVPAARLVAGFDEPESNLRYLLTPADTRDKVAAGDLAAVARLAARLVEDALPYVRTTITVRGKSCRRHPTAVYGLSVRSMAHGIESCSSWYLVDSVPGSMVRTSAAAGFSGNSNTPANPAVRWKGLDIRWPCDNSNPLKNNIFFAR